VALAVRVEDSELLAEPVSLPDPEGDPVVEALAVPVPDGVLAEECVCDGDAEPVADEVESAVSDELVVVLEVGEPDPVPDALDDAEPVPVGLLLIEGVPVPVGVWLGSAPVEMEAL